MDPLKVENDGVETEFKIGDSIVFVEYDRSSQTVVTANLEISKEVHLQKLSMYFDKQRCGKKPDTAVFHNGETLQAQIDAFKLEILKSLEDDLEESRCKLNGFIENERGAWMYPHILFYNEDVNSNIAWRKGADGRGAETLPQGKDLKYLNEQCGLVNSGGMGYVCSSCGEAKKPPKAGFIFASSYCPECAKKPSIMKALNDSKRPGFYD